MAQRGWSQFVEDNWCQIFTLKRDQVDCQGDAACTVIACVVGWWSLEYRYEVESETVRLPEFIEKLDACIDCGSTFWREAGLGFCSAYEALKHIELFRDNLYIENEIQTVIPEYFSLLYEIETERESLESNWDPVRQEQLSRKYDSIIESPMYQQATREFKKLKDTDIVLDELMPQLRGDIFLLFTAQGFSFVIFQIQSYYYIVDSHRNSFFSRADCLPVSYQNCISPLTRDRGLCLRTINFQDIKHFVAHYLDLQEELMKNIIDLIVIRTKKQP